VSYSANIFRQFFDIHNAFLYLTVIA
jgi:hypothetical protein